MEKATWKQVDAGLRAELEALLAAPTEAFLSDFKDALGWWLLILLASLLGIGLAIWNIATEPVSVGEYVEMFTVQPVESLSMFPSVLLLPAGLIVGAFVVVTALRSKGRRGFAALKQALVVVRGSKLRVLYYRDIASAERTVIGKAGKRFTVLSLKLSDGTTEELSVHGGWAEEVVRRLDAKAS